MGIISSTIDYDVVLDEDLHPNDNGLKIFLSPLQRNIVIPSSLGYANGWYGLRA